MRYLAGDKDHVGARDASVPRQDRFARAPLQLRFAGTSTRWGNGGVCFVDLDPSGDAIVRAWDVTAEQFEDVFAQENRQPVGMPLDWSAIVAKPTEITPTWYGLVVPVDLPFASSTQPALTFTWKTPLPLNPPAAAYRGTIERGLADHPDLSPDDIAAYLDAAMQQDDSPDLASPH